MILRKDKSIRLGGTLTIPSGRKKYTGVVLVSATGKQDRNGSMAGHPMFKVLAASLTRLGYAALHNLHCKGKCHP